MTAVLYLPRDEVSRFEWVRGGGVMGWSPGISWEHSSPAPLKRGVGGHLPRGMALRTQCDDAGGRRGPGPSTRQGLDFWEQRSVFADHGSGRKGGNQD